MNRIRVFALVILISFMGSVFAQTNPLIFSSTFDGLCATCGVSISVEASPETPLPGRFFTTISEAAPAGRSASLERMAEVATIIGAEPMDVTLIPALSIAGMDPIQPETYVLTYMSTAEAMLLMSPNIATQDPQRARQIITTARGLPATAALGQWLQAHPRLIDLDGEAFRVQYANALQTLLSALNTSANNVLVDVPTVAPTVTPAYASFDGNLATGEFTWEGASTGRIVLTHKNRGLLDSVSQIGPVPTAQESLFFVGREFATPESIPLLQITTAQPLYGNVMLKSTLGEIPSPLTAMIEQAIASEFGNGVFEASINTGEMQVSNRVFQIRKFTGARLVSGSPVALAITGNTAWRRAHERARKSNMIKAAADYLESIFSLAAYSIRTTSCAQGAISSLSQALPNAQLTALGSENAAVSLLTSASVATLDAAVACGGSTLAARAIARLLVRMAPAIGTAVTAWDVSRASYFAARASARVYAMFSSEPMQQAFLARRHSMVFSNTSSLFNTLASPNPGRLLRTNFPISFDPPLLSTTNSVPVTFTCSDPSLCNANSFSVFLALGAEGILQLYLYRTAAVAPNVRELCINITSAGPVLPPDPICVALVDADATNASYGGVSGPNHGFSHYSESTYGTRIHDGPGGGEWAILVNGNLVAIRSRTGSGLEAPTDYFDSCNNVSIPRLINYTVTSNGGLRVHAGNIRYSDPIVEPPPLNCTRWGNNEQRPFRFELYDANALRAATDPALGVFLYQVNWVQ